MIGIIVLCLWILLIHLLITYIYIDNTRNPKKKMIIGFLLFGLLFVVFIVIGLVFMALYEASRDVVKELRK